MRQSLLAERLPFSEQNLTDSHLALDGENKKIKANLAKLKQMVPGVNEVCFVR